MNLKEITKPITVKSLNETLAKRFGKKLNVQQFTNEQLDDARNKLRTQLSAIETNESFDDVHTSDTYQKSKLMLDVLNAEIAERAEKKPDDDGDGVPDWADKKPGEDDHAKKDDDHGHDDEHKEDGHDDEHKEDGHDEHGHEGHAHGEYDPHIWLDPSNAKVILKEMAEHLIEKDQKNASVYKSNLKKALKDLDRLIKDVKSELDKDFKSIVFHDAYQYFEKRFDVNVMGAFTVNTDVMPGAEQLSEIREIIEHDKVSCVFSEPQFNPDIINAVAKDMNISTGVLDPLGATLNPGKDLYFDLIKNMSKSFKGC